MGAVSYEQTAWWETGPDLSSFEEADKHIQRYLYTLKSSNKVNIRAAWVIEKKPKITIWVNVIIKSLRIN